MLCDFAIVGGGPGGVYAGMRLAEGAPNTSVCLFEAAGRLGRRGFASCSAAGVPVIAMFSPSRQVGVPMGTVAVPGRGGSVTLFRP